MKKRSWVAEFIKECIWDCMRFIFLFVITFILSTNILFSLIIAAIPILLVKTYFRFVLKRLPKSKFYKLPQITCKGIIIEEQTHNFNLFDYFYRDWVVIKTLDGHKIKAYASSWYGLNTDVITFLGAYDFTPFKIYDTGILYYRKGKKYNYFEHFKPKLILDD